MAQSEVSYDMRWGGVDPIFWVTLLNVLI